MHNRRLTAAALCLFALLPLEVERAIAYPVKPPYPAESSGNLPPKSDRAAYRAAMRQRAEQFFQQGDIKNGLHDIEESYLSELAQFLDREVEALPSPPAIKQQQLREASEKTGSPTALVFPASFRDRLVVVMLPPSGKPVLRSVPAPAEAVRAAIAEFRANLQDAASRDYLVQAQQFYDWIVRPIEAELESDNIQTLVFVLDGGLRAIPPAAFHDGRDFLIAKYAVATIPSSREIDLSQRDRAQSRVLAMGLSASVAGLPALPSVSVEIETISSKLLPGSFILNQPFTAANLIAERPKRKANVVHLATHAEFAVNRARDAFVQFWDSRVTVNDISRLGLRDVDLVVLSACQTAVGADLGIAGFALNSGARSVMASLWPISDLGTAPLMMGFYSAWRTAPSKAIALQRAQLAMLRGNVRVEGRKIDGIRGLSAIALPAASHPADLTHPFFWSPFILVGNWL